MSDEQLAPGKQRPDTQSDPCQRKQSARERGDRLARRYRGSALAAHEQQVCGHREHDGLEQRDRLNDAKAHDLKAAPLHQRSRSAGNDSPDSRERAADRQVEPNRVHRRHRRPSFRLIRDYLRLENL